MTTEEMCSRYIVFQKCVYRFSVNEVAPPQDLGGGAFEKPLGVILEFQTEMFGGPPQDLGGGATSFTELR